LIHLSSGDFAKGKFDTLLDILEDKVSVYDIDHVFPINVAARKEKTVTGKLTGGNLTLLEASLGTCWEFQTLGKILFVEDINLKPWWIYRTMYHFKEIGKLVGLKAIVFGRFVSTGSTQSEVGSFLCKFADSIDIPVYITDQFGHGNCNKPLIYDALATLHDNKMTIQAK
jgi:muramoyltetrapeptide carboxypeptidase